MKKLLVSPLTGQIYLTAVKDMGNGRFLSTGKKEDYTEETLRAAFEWFMCKVKETENARAYEIKYEGVPYVLEMRKIETDKEENKKSSS